MSSGKFAQLNPKEGQYGPPSSRSGAGGGGPGPSLRPLSQSSSGGDSAYGGALDVLGDYNGASTIRRVGPSSSSSSTASEPPVFKSSLPLTRTPASSLPPSSFGRPSNAPQHATPSTPSLAPGGMRAPTSVSRMKPLALTARHPAPPPPAPSVIVDESSPASSGFFPKFKAKLTDGSRATKKGLLGGTSQAHIVTPARSQHAFMSSSSGRAQYESSGDEGTQGDWNIVEQDEGDEDFWEGEGTKEKENVKVSIRSVCRARRRHPGRREDRGELARAQRGD